MLIWFVWFWLISFTMSKGIGLCSQKVGWQQLKGKRKNQECFIEWLRTYLIITKVRVLIPTCAWDMLYLLGSCPTYGVTYNQQLELSWLIYMLERQG